MSPELTKLDACGLPGNAYAITADGRLRDAVFLETSLGAAYTPIALDRTGRVFALNNGHLSVLGHK